MAEQYLSPIWYRVARLTPRLRPHVSVHRHRYRGRPWYVLHDHAGGRVHRFTPAAYLLIGQFDGRRTVEEVWHDLAQTFDEEAPSQADVIELMSKLHQNDLLQLNATPDIAELLERHRRLSGQIVKQNLLNPISFRLPLWDPDAFLARTMPLVRPLTGWFGAIVWLALVTAGGVTAAMHWEAISADIATQLLSFQNVVISLLVYPVLKALHELAHGWLAKARGAEVREMGIMFLVFFPVPYVDASAASAFRSKWQRAAVSAGGIAIESAVAAVAVMLWVDAEPGVFRAVCYSLMTVGGLSTILVNANPLLKFDGYYVMTDIVEIPNLATRANRFWGHLVKRYVFGARQLREKVATPGERVWFVLYAPAAFVYRIVVMLGIALYVATEYLVIGMVLAAWSIFNALVKPLAKALHHTATTPQLRKVRGRANAIAFGGLGLAVAALMLVPLPLRTDTEGVVWLPEAAHVRAGTPGFVSAIAAARGAPVAAGAPLARLEEPTLATRLEVLRWRIEEQRRRLQVAEVRDRREAEPLRLALEETVAERERERARAARLDVRAPLDGRFEPALPPESLTGRFLAQGDLIGYVLPPRAEVIRVVVGQDDVSLVRERLAGVEVKLAGHLERRHAARLVRAVPSATGTLPSPALATVSGGPFLTDPAAETPTTMLRPGFVFDLEAPGALADAAFGTRVLVRFDHGLEPAGLQLWRRLRQLFLSEFAI